MEEKCRAHVYIKGRVQGVFFRYTTQQEAQRLRIKGWVRNLRDGRVEAVFEGRKESVEQMVSWCHYGPPGAVVKDVDVHWETPTGEFNSFFVA